MSTLPEKNERYGEREYWNERYSGEENKTFDWFKTYADVAPILRELIPNKNARILMLGCGNSTLSEDMYDDGYTNIVNVDYSSVVIAQMKARHEGVRPGMEWKVMDVRALEFNDASFDVAIDKGTMDAMMTAKGDVWDPPAQVIADCTAEVSSVLRVLRPSTSTSSSVSSFSSSTDVPGSSSSSGIFLYLTFGQPHFRKRYLTGEGREGTTLEVREMGEMFHYYLYVLRKGKEV
ncbi:S-adenosyl-L-methionine-dependent methyltransferase [Cylindrobasidium torrendii FP15055 ss-10]|uniref:S-adenosyl-L-methionine-dependent methyltransferase n=1 Tax=Cylindrobasidium torrendii FP15055 ss-10 TaxID=1314674 RepID=A0A0D7BFJ8_9AGAR|nr:S-adenosyl-L-methionine-dependent methyltransferase [Cylindrobasidium torrendii FP15055 ss-10]